ncbi:5,6-dimethylbenzimidazole synthase [Geothrix limicola]|uniref:5,6-dimethylbenzimidazole synthase n=1 Tax=Geothrix limicola TaxID=2927978 RepID=A0ABQ5QFA0_9BACT|nr:5,6-dimethylbenzimidazole synthase [Geothrix limicola]GLH73477.1 5,6-dimethylbenzimidazole synthase [Geothrix limicola]
MHAFSEAFRAELDALLRARRDVRRFRRDPVPEPLLLHLLEQANLAPSVGLSQPWRFIRVQSPKLRAAVATAFEAANAAAASGYEGARAETYKRLKLEGLGQAPEHLLICCETAPAQGHGLGRQTQPQTLRDSVVCAIQILWLAARAEGLGIGWVSILDPQGLREAFDLPPTWEWVAYLCVGWPEAFLDIPELEAEGWEQRRPLADVLERR